MIRRDFIKLIATSLASCPLVAVAQRAIPVRALLSGRHRSALGYSIRRVFAGYARATDYEEGKDYCSNGDLQVPELGASARAGEGTHRKRKVSCYLRTTSTAAGIMAAHQGHHNNSDCDGFLRGRPHRIWACCNILDIRPEMSRDRLL